MKQEKLNQFKKWIEDNQIKVGDQMVAHDSYNKSYGYKPRWKCYKICSVTKIDFEHGHLITELGKYKLGLFTWHLIPVSEKSIILLKDGEFVNGAGYTAMTPNELCPIDNLRKEYMTECDEWTVYHNANANRENMQKELNQEYLNQCKVALSSCEEQYHQAKLDAFTKICCANCANFDEDNEYCGHTESCSAFEAQIKGEKYVIRNSDTGKLQHGHYYGPSLPPNGVYKVPIYELRGEAKRACDDLNNEYTRWHWNASERMLPLWRVEVYTEEIEQEISNLIKELGKQEKKK